MVVKKVQNGLLRRALTAGGWSTLTGGQSGSRLIVKIEPVDSESMRTMIMDPRSASLLMFWSNTGKQTMRQSCEQRWRRCKASFFPNWHCPQTPSTYNWVPVIGHNIGVPKDGCRS